MSTHKDPGGVLKDVHDEASNSLKVSLNPVQLNISAEADSIRLGDGTNLTTTTVVDSKVGLDVAVVGGILQQSGLSKGIATQEIEVTDIPIKIPSIPLTDRNGISIRVWNLADTTIIVYFGDGNLTTLNGYPKGHGEEIVMDVTDNPNVEIYAVCETGKSAKVRVMEVA